MVSKAVPSIMAQRWSWDSKIAVKRTTVFVRILTYFKQILFLILRSSDCILIISQNWQENTCAIVSFLIKLQRPAILLKNRLWDRCFPVNFLKFLRRFFYRTPLGDSFQIFMVSVILQNLAVTGKLLNWFVLKTNWLVPVTLLITK